MSRPCATGRPASSMTLTFIFRKSPRSAGRKSSERIVWPVSLPSAFANAAYKFPSPNFMLRFLSPAIKRLQPCHSGGHTDVVEGVSCLHIREDVAPPRARFKHLDVAKKLLIVPEERRIKIDIAFDQRVMNEQFAALARI